MAIAALSVDRLGEHRRGRGRARSEWRCGSPSAMRCCSRWAPVCSCWSAGRIPLVVERGGEMLGGALLIVLGAMALWGVGAGRVYGHSHRHGQEPRAHWHLHVGRRDRHPAAAAHSHLPTMIGAAFAVSSLRALAMLTPFGDRLGAAPLPLLLAADRRLCRRDPAVDVALRRRPRRASCPRALARLGHGAGALVGLSSVVLGVAWVLTA